MTESIHRRMTESTITAENLVPAADPHTPVGWVAERYVDDSVEWWDGERWQDLLSDGAKIYANEERTDLDAGGGPATWVEVWAHEVDGCLTTEKCSGMNVCSDCLDVRRQAGEMLDVPDPSTPVGALDYAIFALNTLAHPDASDGDDMDRLDEASDTVLDTLVRLRDSLVPRTQAADTVDTKEA